MKKYKTYKNNAGISMVALVITIIVILIVAGITIAVLLGDNGIISKTQEARESTEYARAQEEVARKWIEVEREHLTYNEDNDDMAGYLEEKLRDVKDNDNKNETTVRYNDATQTFEIASYKGYDMELQMDGKVTDKGTTPGTGGEEPAHVERASVKIDTHPQSQTILAGQNATLTVTLDNEEVTGTVTYQWYEVSSNTSVGGKAIEGENQATYQITNASNNDDKYYYCEVTATYENPTTHQTTTAKEKTTPAKITVITTDITVAQNKVVVNEGETIKLEIQTKNDSGITYQWYKTDDPSNLAKDSEKAIAGATQATYEKPNAQTSDDGYYYCIVTKTLNGETIESTSEPIQVTVKIPVEITQEPTDIYEMVGRTVQFSVATKGNGTITYQWYKTYQNSNTSGTTISNETGTTLTISSIDLQSDAYYYCEIKQTFEADSSNQTIKTRPAKLSAIDAFRIKTQPESQSKLEGAEVTFSVETSETKGDLTYQWYKTTNSNEAGTPIERANQSTYTIERTKSSDGAYYYVEITQNYNGAIDTVKSEPALLTIVSKVEIATNPTTPIQTIAETEDITFEILESGQGNMSFQWYVATNTVEPGTPIENTNSRTYTIPKEEVLANLNGTYYYAEVTQTYNNKTAKATSNRALLTVVTPVRVTTQPAPATVTDGNTATFKVETEGTSVPGLTYQWYKTTTNDNTTGEEIQNATSSTYTTPQVISDDSGTYYYCVITQHYGGVTAEARTVPALLTVGQTVQIQDPSDVLVIEHKDNVSFTVGTQGSPAFSYQWYRNTENSNEGGTPITGATLATYTIQKEEVNTNLNGTYYYAKVTQKYGESTRELITNAAQLSVVAQARITANPASIRTIEGVSNISFTAQAVGESVPQLSYQWYKNTTGSNTVGTLIENANDRTYTINKQDVTTELSGTYYYCVVTQQYGISTHEVSTQSALLNVASILTITKHPLAVLTIAEKSDVTFSASASASGTLRYQWYYTTNNEENGTEITGANQSTYTIPAQQVTTNLNNRHYYAVITQDYYGTTLQKTTNKALLTVTEQVQITSEPANVSVTEGNTATFAVTAQGTATPELKYQWYKADSQSGEGTAIPGATQRTYTTPSLTTADNGKYYYVVVTQNYGTPNESNATDISRRALLSVGKAGIIANPNNAYVIEHKSAVSFNAHGSGDGTYTYQWYRTNQAGSTNPTEDATKAITGETSETYTITAENVHLSLNDTYYYCVAKQTYEGNVTTLISTSARLSVIPQMSISTIPTGATTIAGKTATFNAEADGQGQISYQWYKTNQAGSSNPSGADSEKITGATGNTYTTPELTTSDNNTYYYCVITQKYGTSTHTITTPAAPLTVVAPIEILSQPTAQSKIEGDTATFTVNINDTEGNISYQWYRVDSLVGGTPTPINGATHSSYTTEPTNVNYDNGKYYYCVIIQKYGNPEVTVKLTTERVLLSVTAEGGITVQPKPVSTTAGSEDVTFSITAVGEDTLTYQWYKTDQAGSANLSGANNEKINGETSRTYTIAAASVTTALNNTYYYCIVKQAYGTSQKTYISNAAQLTVKDGNYSVTVGTTKTYYETLELALEEVPNEGTIVQEKNCTDASAPIVRGKDVVFDNNGKTLTKTTAGINVEAGAELEIAGDGTITTGDAITLIENNGILNLTHTGTIKGTRTGNITLIINRGVLSKTGNGTITSPVRYATIGVAGTNASATISAGNVKNTGTAPSQGIHTQGRSNFKHQRNC